jgi:hypothetical protein
VADGYQGIDRVLRLDANHLASCERTVTYFSKTEAATSLREMILIARHRIP